MVQAQKSKRSSYGTNTTRSRHNNSEKRGQIAHLDRNPANNDESNLVFLCLPHHDQYDSRTSQSKGITEAELRYYRDELVNQIAARRQQTQQSSSDNQVPPELLTDRWGYPTYLRVDELPDESPKMLRDFSPKAISTYLSTYSPLRRPIIAEELFRGHWVEWKGTVKIIQDGDGCYMMHLLADDESIFAVTFPLSDHAMLEDLQEDERVVVRGQILKAYSSIELVKPLIRKLETRPLTRQWPWQFR